MKQTTIVVAVIEKDGKFLATSRKKNHELFGFPGGKVEHTDKSILNAIIRETKEETGINIIEAELVHTEPYNGELTFAFKINKWSGTPYTDEVAISKGEGIVRWLNVDQLSFGFCGSYNKKLLNKLNHK